MDGIRQTAGYLQKEPSRLSEGTGVQLLCAASYDVWLGCTWTLPKQAQNKLAVQPVPSLGKYLSMAQASFYFRVSGRKFVQCLFGECPCTPKPYVIAGSTQELYTSPFRQTGRFLLKISRCLAYAVQPAMILR